MTRPTLTFEQRHDLLPERTRLAHRQTLDDFVKCYVVLDRFLADESEQVFVVDSVPPLKWSLRILGAVSLGGRLLGLYSILA